MPKQRSWVQFAPELHFKIKLKRILKKKYKKFLRIFLNAIHHFFLRIVDCLTNFLVFSLRMFLDFYLKNAREVFEPKTVERN
jgi:hypothetical protein